ncbi:MAG: MBL fold metallo-hydrolase [Archaeoglobi archaeon]|nr:MBL fold metallo-hydrolase [Candidatus Mnemosynella bozhongmuii]
MKPVRRILPHFYSGNVYLIEDEKNVLVDAGISGERVVRNLREMGIREIDYLILTHCHYDHSAGVGDIVREFSPDVLLHEAEVDKRKDPEYSVSWMFGEEPPEYEVDVPLKGGELISTGERSLRVIHTPGHSPGSICLYEESTGELFSGDTVFPDGGIGRTDLKGGSSEKLRDSIRRLLELDVRVLYPGHGEILREGVRRSLELSLRFASMIL